MIHGFKGQSAKLGFKSEIYNQKSETWSCISRGFSRIHRGGVAVGFDI